MVDTIIRKEFRKKLIDNDLSINEFAKKHNYSRTYFSAVLNGRIESYEIERLIREYARTETN